MPAGLGQPQTTSLASSESEFITESRKLDQTTEQLKELLSSLDSRTGIVRVSLAATPDSPTLKDPRPEQQLSSLGHFLRAQRDKVKDACRLVETILNELRI